VVAIAQICGFEIRGNELQPGLLGKGLNFGRQWRGHFDVARSDTDRCVERKTTLVVFYRFGGPVGIIATKVFRHHQRNRRDLCAGLADGGIATLRGAVVGVAYGWFFARLQRHAGHFLIVASLTNLHGPGVFGCVWATTGCSTVAGETARAKHAIMVERFCVFYIVFPSLAYTRIITGSICTT